MSEPVKTDGGKGADYLRSDMQHCLGRHRAVLLDPRVEPLPGYAFRDINEMLFLASEIQNLGHIDVIKSLGAARLLFELLPHCWIDAFDRDEF